MSHVRLLFVGGKKNLDQIYADCPDSSSEAEAEMAFGYDWINSEADGRWVSEEFTSKDTELYRQVVEGIWHHCLDIRDTERYGDYTWVNRMSEGVYSRASYEEMKSQTISDLKNFPSDTTFFFAEAHL